MRRRRRDRWRCAEQFGEVDPDVGVAVDAEACDVGAVVELPRGWFRVPVGRPSRAAVAANVGVDRGGVSGAVED